MSWPLLLLMGATSHAGEHYAALNSIITQLDTSAASRYFVVLARCADKAALMRAANCSHGDGELFDFLLQAASFDEFFEAFDRDYPDGY